DAEASRSDLLDRASAKIAVLVGEVTYRILAALAGIRFPPDPIHRDRQVLVRFAADRAERHRAGLEALDDLCSRFDLFPRTRQPAQRAELLALVVDDSGVLLEQLVASAAHRMLELGDRFGVVRVVFASPSPLVLTARVELPIERRRHAVGVVVPRLDLGSDRF